jgi:hypothetical protein
MTRALLSLFLLAAVAGSAAAEKKIQVLHADGRADAKVRAKIDAAVLVLAKATGDQIVPGDITFVDAAAAVGCNPDEAACRDEVLGMLSVDELVTTTVTPKPGGFDVAVRRVGKGGVTRDATSFVTADRLDKLDTIAPLFSASGTPPPTPPAPLPPAIGPPSPTSPPSPTGTTTTPPTTTPPSPAVTTTTPPPDSETGPVRPGPTAPPAITAEPRPSPIMTQPPGSDKIDRPRGRRRLQTFGMAGGGAMLLVGLILWGSASSVQGEIDAAPIATKAQIVALQDLEQKGDTYAGLGNLFVVGGLVLGGVSTYYFVKGNRRRATSARLVPTMSDRGGGLAIVIGGSP